MMNATLKFRRQYLLSQTICESLLDWQHQLFGSFHIYNHPDLDVNITEPNKNNLSLALIGYMLDPNHPDKSNIEILNDMLDSVNTIDNISEYLYNIAGRFVLLVNSPTDTFIFHDPCGLRTVFYAKYEGKVFIGSQPLIFEHVIPLKKGDVFYSYQKSTYKENNIEHWIPSGYSLYDDVYHLIPNHYLQCSTLKQTRYWPIEKLQKINPHTAEDKVAILLKKLMTAASKRFDLALPLTAGWDSRILLAASKNIAPDIFFYTLQYRDLQLRSNDIRIPKELLHSLGYVHHLINCQKVLNIEFYNIYKKNVSMQHKNWAEIAYGMYGSYPDDKVCIKGNAAEIGRLSGLSGRAINSVDEIIDYLVPGWDTVPFIKEQLTPWYTEAREVASKYEIDLHSLFYWEHRMGSWQAQSQLEWDIVQEAFTPFNHRGLQEITLGVPPKYRSAPDYILYQNTAKILWGKVMKYPINPPENIKERFTSILSYFGLKEVIRKRYKKFLGSLKNYVSV